MPAIRQQKYCHVLMSHTWTAEDAYELRGASAVVADRDHVAQRTPLIFSHGIEDIDEIIRSASPREDDNAFGFQGAIGRWG
jgi:hypothetical protein